MPEPPSKPLTPVAAPVPMEGKGEWQKFTLSIVGGTVASLPLPRQMPSSCGSGRPTAPASSAGSFPHPPAFPELPAWCAQGPQGVSSLVSALIYGHPSSQAQGRALISASPKPGPGLSKH